MGVGIFYVLAFHLFQTAKDEADIRYSNAGAALNPVIDGAIDLSGNLVLLSSGENRDLHAGHDDGNLRMRRASTCARRSAAADAHHYAGAKGGIKALRQM